MSTPQKKVFVLSYTFTYNIHENIKKNIVQSALDITNRDITNFFLTNHKK